MDLSKLSERLDGQPMFQLLSIAKDLEKQGSKIIHFEIPHGFLNLSNTLKHTHTHVLYHALGPSNVTQTVSRL